MLKPRRVGRHYACDAWQSFNLFGMSGERFARLTGMCSLWEILKQTFVEWQEDRVPRLGAALAYYSLFSLAPALVIAVALAGAFYGREAAEGKLADELENIVGRQVARELQQLTESIHSARGGPYATLVSGVLLLIGATGAVVALKDALNTVWGVVDTTRGVWWILVRDRLLSLVLVLGGGLLLIGSVVMTSFLQAMSDRALAGLPFSFSTAVVINWLVSLVVVSAFFTMVFRILPDVALRWRDVWLGSAVTSVLFLIGRELIAFYLAHFSFSSTYGAAGSLVAVLLWVYYSAQIILLGAEFTQVYARRCGVQGEPLRGAVVMNEAQRSRQATLHKGPKIKR
ncbi:MAG TPA: YihY/virulence factor BrkB family protein [Pirellulales bacterium]|nr:YihY/virulence factor BrkB family protein [Pirellulales bacterium]